MKQGGGREVVGQGGRQRQRAASSEGWRKLYDRAYYYFIPLPFLVVVIAVVVVDVVVVDIVVVDVVVLDVVVVDVAVVAVVVVW